MAVSRLTGVVEGAVVAVVVVRHRGDDGGLSDGDCVFVGRMAGAKMKSRKGVEQGRLVLQHSRLSLQPCCSRSG